MIWVKAIEPKEGAVGGIFPIQESLDIGPGPSIKLCVKVLRFLRHA